MKIGERSRRAAHGPISLNMTSMIDAVFLLLSYFIFTTMAGEQEAHLMADVTAMRPGSGASALSPQIVEVQSDAGGSLFRVGANQVRQRDQLAAILKQLPHEPGVVVRVHRGPDVAAVAAAMQAAQDAGFEKVSYVAAGK
jgi:biopolymer transport protein ExbD